MRWQDICQRSSEAGRPVKRAITNNVEFLNIYERIIMRDQDLRLYQYYFTAP